MFTEIESRVPHLILLHHNWSAISISKILERLAAACDATRVIVFTGQRVKTAELVECVRSGVADYWERDAMNTDFIFNQISHYCFSSVYAIKALRLSSGSVAQLAKRLERESELRRTAEAQREALAQKVQALESGELNATTRDLRSIAKVIAIALVLLAAFLLANRFTNVGPAWSLGFVFLCGVVILFFERKISFAQLKLGQGSAVVRNQDKDP